MLSDTTTINKEINEELSFHEEVSKLKVLFVIDTLQLGGAEQSLLENTSGFQFVHPVVCHLYSGDILKQKFLERNIRVYSFNIKKKYGFIQAHKNLNKIIKKEKPDVIVAYLTRSEIVSRIAGKLNNIPVVGTFVNDLYCKSYNQHLSFKARMVVQLFKLINKITSNICAGFISNSHYIKEANAAHLDIPLSKIKVISRGRKSSLIIKKEPIVTYTRQIRFLNVSRLFEVKGHKLLIQGFKKFNNYFENATLDIIGDGPLKGELQALINENNLHNKINLLGSRKDVPSILHEYDCFVFPSLVEGFSGAVVEAMFANLPVLASDIPQNKEAVTHLQTGYLFKKNSVTDISDAMLWFSANRRAATEFANAAYNFARENFEQKNIVGQLENYLLNVAQEK